MEPEGSREYRILRTLVGHFFRRFFDNDTVHVQGDTVTTVVRALAAVAAPGLLIAFFLQNQYPQRPLWGAIQDQYLFVLFSFVAMGAVAVVEWEMLFPDRSDFLVMAPLSLKPWMMLAGKATALSGFLLMFLFSSNVFGILVLPAASKGAFYRHVWAHAAAVLLAGSFAALTLLAVGGTMLCVLDPRRFRVASPLLQMGTVVLLTLFLLHYARYGGADQAWLEPPIGWVRWVPPYWFLGVYEKLLRGASAPAFASELAKYAYWGNGIAAIVVLVTYPTAWSRMQRMAIEGVTASGRATWRGWSQIVGAIVTRPAERAVFHFIGYTVARNARYQVYLAIYGGLGLALAIGCATEFNTTTHGLRPALSQRGLYALVPLSVFWTIAGLRSAFAFPMNLGAGWIFRVSGAKVSECGAAARHWGLGFAWTVTAAIAGLLFAAGWSAWRVFVQLVCGACLGVLLTDAFLASEEHVPFNRPRMPGRANFPLMLTLYLGVLPLYVAGVMQAELALEKSVLKLMILVVGTVLIHVALQGSREEPAIVEEDLEGYDDEFQLLGLS